MLDKEYSSEVCPTQTASSTIDDQAAINYIGGYIYKKNVENRCLSNEEIFSSEMSSEQ